MGNKINYRRYSVNKTTWGPTQRVGRFQVMEADLNDHKTGDVFRGGAAKVVDTTTGKTVDDRGKPNPRWVFAGETAHADARRAAYDADMYVAMSRSGNNRHGYAWNH